MSTIGIERIERDESQVIVPSEGEPYGIVLQVPFGPLIPALVNNPDDLIRFFAPSGKPDPDFKDYAEAELLLKVTPLLVCRPQGDALFGGVTVEEFGTGNTTDPLSVGIPDPVTFSFSDNLKQFALFGANPSAKNNDFSVDIVASTTEVANTFDINLFKNGVLVQSFNVSLIKTQLNGFGNSVYIEEVLKNRSDITITVNLNADLTKLPEFTTSPVVFGGGVTITDFSNAADTITAWNNFKEFNRFFTRRLVDTSANFTIGKAVLDIATENFFQFVFLAAPSIKATNPNATESLNTFRINTLAYRDINGSQLNVNDDHGTLYANWGLVNDNSNNTTVWISPASMAASRKSFTEKNISISQAAVGANQNRGVVSEVIVLEQDVTSIIDALDKKQINVMSYSPAGIVVWNEKTLQVQFTNTSFVSHRTYFFFLEENIENNLFFFVFTDISEDVRADIKSLIETFTNTQIGIHAEDIQVRVPEDPELAAQRKLKVQVAVIPFPKANKIIFEFIHARTGVDLNEVF